MNEYLKSKLSELSKEERESVKGFLRELDKEDFKKNFPNLKQPFIIPVQRDMPYPNVKVGDVVEALSLEGVGTLLTGLVHVVENCYRGSTILVRGDVVEESKGLFVKVRVDNVTYSSDNATYLLLHELQESVGLYKKEDVENEIKAMHITVEEGTFSKIDIARREFFFRDSPAVCTEENYTRIYTREGSEKDMLNFIKEVNESESLPAPPVDLMGVVQAVNDKSNN